MKKILISIILLLCAGTYIYAQYYIVFTRQADSLYKRGHYQKAADTYKQAVDIHASEMNKSGARDPFFWKLYENIYNCYNNMAMTDSVYKYMEAAILNGNTSYQIFTNNRFYREYTDPRMQRLITLSDSLYVVSNPTADHETGLALRHMHLQDFRIRQEMEIMEIRKASRSKMDSLYIAAYKIDSANMIRLIPILEKYGYPNASVVGNDYTAITTPLVVLQHADIKFQKKYHKLLRQAAEAGDIPMFSYAFITDQMMVSQGKKQIYGTQYRTVGGKKELYPIQAPKQLHKRLAKINLE